MTQKLTSVDNAFFQLESHDTPMHVAGLQIFTLPTHAPADYVQNLVAHLRSPTQLSAPWNVRLRQSALGRGWRTDRDVNLDYHVRHLALPRPGGERELGALVSRLHSQRLSRHRPLWECHVIEGLERNRFAIYTKIHHALADGVTTIRLLTQALSEAPDAATPAPWAATDAPTPAPEPARRAPLRKLRAQLATLPALAQASGRMARSAVGAGEAFALPFSAPSSMLNAPVTGQRRYATQQLSIGRLKAAGKAADATVNDVVLALCGSALRRFLKDANALPSRSLVAAVPMSMREPGDTASANAVSIMFAGLGTDIADPVERLRQVKRSTAGGKSHLRAIPKGGHPLYNSLLLAPFALQVITGIGAQARPCFNVTVSNVPGPNRPMYLQGAALEAFYPVSIAAHGQAVNITCTSYNGSLNFGIAGCRDALPHLQRVAVYLGEALGELEAAIGLTQAPPQRVIRNAA